MIAEEIIKEMMKEKRCSICNGLVTLEDIPHYAIVAQKKIGIKAEKYYPMYCKKCTEIAIVF